MKLISKYVMTQMLMRGGGNSTRWVWTLNGMSYGVIPVADVVSGSVIDLEIETPSSALAANKSIFWSESGNDCFCRISTDGTLAFGGGTVSFDGVPVSFGFPVPLDGARHTIAFTVNVTAGIKFLGVRNTLGEHYTGKILSFRATGVTSPNYPSTTFNYELKEDYSDNHIAADSDNQDGAEQYTGIAADWDTFDATITIENGVIRVTNTANTKGYARLTVIGKRLALRGYSALGTGGAYSQEAWKSPPFSGVSSSGIIEFTANAEGEISLRCNGTAIGDYAEFTIESVKQTTAMQKFNDLPEDYTEVPV